MKSVGFKAVLILVGMMVVAPFSFASLDSEDGLELCSNIRKIDPTATRTDYNVCIIAVKSHKFQPSALDICRDLPSRVYHDPDGPQAVSADQVVACVNAIANKNYEANELDAAPNQRLTSTQISIDDLLGYLRDNGQPMKK